MNTLDNWSQSVIDDSLGEASPQFQAECLEELRAMLGSSGLRPQNKTPHVLLVGGAGYIGPVVASLLLGNGYRVRCLDALLYENQSCVLPFQLSPNYSFINGDFRDSETVKSALKGISDVIVLGGLVGDPITKKYPDLSRSINIDGVKNVFQQCQKAALNKLVFISTCSNYGLMENGELATEEAKLSPLSLYAEAKVQMEKELLANSSDYVPCATVLRFATAFGLAPRPRFDLTLNEFTRELKLGKELLVFDAKTWRPYCHVKDFANVLQRVLVAPREKVKGQVFNAGGDDNNATKQTLVDTIIKFCPDARVRYKEEGTDPRNYRVSFAKIKKVLEFQPRYSIADGVQEIIHAIDNRLFPEKIEGLNLYGNYEIPEPFCS